MEKEEQKVRQELFKLLANKSNEINKIKRKYEKGIKMLWVIQKDIHARNQSYDLIEALTRLNKQ